MSSQFVDSEGGPDASTPSEVHDFVSLVEGDFRQRPNSGRFSRPVEVIASVADLLALIDDGIHCGALSLKHGTGDILAYMKSIQEAENAGLNDSHPAAPPSFASAVSVPLPAPTIVEPSPSTPPRTPSPLPEPLDDPRPPMLLVANATYAAYTRGVLEPNMNLPALLGSPSPAHSPQCPQQPALVSSSGNASRGANQIPKQSRPLPNPPRPLPVPPTQQLQNQAQVPAMNAPSLPQPAPALSLDQVEHPPVFNSLANSTSQVDVVAPTPLSRFGPRPQRANPRPPALFLPADRPSQGDPFISAHHSAEFSCPPPPRLPPPSCDRAVERDTPSRPSSPTPTRRQEHDCQTLEYMAGASSLRRSSRVLSNPSSPAQEQAPPPSRRLVFTPSIPSEAVIVGDVSTQVDSGDAEEAGGRFLHPGGTSLREYRVLERPRAQSWYTAGKSTASTAVQTQESAFSPPEDTAGLSTGAEAPPYHAGLSTGAEAPPYHAGLGPFSEDDVLFYPEDRKRRSIEPASPNPEPESWLLRSRNPAPPSPALAPSPPPAPPQQDAYHYPNQQRLEDIDWNKLILDFRVKTPPPRALSKLRDGVQKFGALFRLGKDSGEWRDGDVAGGVAPRPGFDTTETMEESTIEIINYLFLIHHEGMHKFFPHIMGGSSSRQVTFCFDISII